MNILNYLYNQDTDLDEVLEGESSQTVGSREPVLTQNPLLSDAITFAKDAFEHQFDGLNNTLQTVH